MGTFYRDASVQVSTRSVDVAGRAYPVRELTRVWHRRGRPDRRVAGRLAIRCGLIGLLVSPFAVRASAATQIWTSDRGLTHKLGAAVALATVSLVVLAFLLPLAEIVLSLLARNYDHGLRVREVWVRWRGQDVLVLRTADATRFRHLYRAIQRAVERDDRLRAAGR